MSANETAIGATLTRNDIHCGLQTLPDELGNRASL